MTEADKHVRCRIVEDLLRSRNMMRAYAKRWRSAQSPRQGTVELAQAIYYRGAAQHFWGVLVAHDHYSRLLGVER